MCAVQDFSSTFAGGDGADRDVARRAYAQYQTVVDMQESFTAVRLFWGGGWGGWLDIRCAWMGLFGPFLLPRGWSGACLRSSKAVGSGIIARLSSQYG